MTNETAAAWLEFISAKHGFRADTATVEPAPRRRTRRAADEPVEPTPTAAAKSLSGSVGRGGRNARADVTLVQERLNENGERLSVDGVAGSKTIRAIRAFQQRSLGFADGRIEPGRQTWRALDAPGSPAGDPAASDRDAGDRQEPETAEGRTRSDESERGPNGADFDPKTTIQTPLVTVQVKTGPNGKITSGTVALQAAKSTTLKANVAGPYFLGFSVKLGQLSASFQGTLPVANITGKLSASGSGTFGVGYARVMPTEPGGKNQNATVGIQAELIFETYVTPFRATADFDRGTFDWTGMSFPIEVPLKATLRAGAVIEVQGFGIQQTIDVASYDRILILAIGGDGLLSLRLGPGFDALRRDIQRAHDQVLEAIEYAKNNPKSVGTGDFTPPKIEGEKPKRAESVADDIDRIANQANVAALRIAENAMRSAFQRGWATPELTGKANALVQRDEARARELYGPAWTQRALAKQKYDQYASPPDTAPPDIVAARIAQAQDIARRFEAAIALFQQGDARG